MSLVLSLQLTLYRDISRIDIEILRYSISDKSFVILLQDFPPFYLVTAIISINYKKSNIFLIFFKISLILLLLYSILPYFHNHLVKSGISLFNLTSLLFVRFLLLALLLALLFDLPSFLFVAYL